MKILVVGDIHGKTEKLEREIPKHEFDFVIGVGDYGGIEEWRKYISYIFKLKDRRKGKSPKEFYGKKKFQKLCREDYHAGKKVLNFLDNLGKPGVFVFGNGDDEWYDLIMIKRMKAKKRNLNFLKKIKVVKNINYGIRKYKGIDFFGFGGYMDVDANNDRDEEWQAAVDKRMSFAEKIFKNFLKKVGKKSIFVFHYPPRGVFDIIKDKKNPYHGGSSGIDFYREAILKKKPLLVLCGHMEEYQGKKKLGNSWVVNPGEGAHGKFAIVEIDEKKGKFLGAKFFGKNF